MNRESMAGEYRLDAEIAKGGFGTVYRATFLPTSATVAVKILHTELFSDPSSTLRFEREAAVVLALPHPNIVKVHECGRLADGRPYIAMELLSGVSLEKHLQSRGRLPVDDVIEILSPVANVLKVAHEADIVHRDIKPSNVFLAEGRKAGHVVLLDFGIAKLLADQGPALTASRSTLGTIPFMAPEQIRGEKIDTRADIYSLGALAYAMLTGKPPYGNQVTAVLRQLHLHARPPKPSERAPVDPALDEPLLRALDPNPQMRPKTAPEFIESLRAAVRRPQRIPSPSRPDVLLRPTLLVSAELRPDASSMAAGDEDLFDAIETSLPLVSSALEREGLVPLRETSLHLVVASPEAPEQRRVTRVVDACVNAYRAFRNGPGKDGRVALSITIHVGFLHTNEAGTLLTSGLVDVASWAPSVSPFGGVVVSKTALGEGASGRAALLGSSEFVWVER